MRTIRLYGELGRRFGRIHRFDVSTPAEALRALCANFKGLQDYFMNAHEQKIQFRVATAGADLSKIEQINDPASQTIKFIPVVVGAGGDGAFQTFLGIALIVTGAVIAPFAPQAGAFFINTGIALTLGGIAQMLSPGPKAPDPSDYESDRNKPNNYFSGPVNTTAQGHPVPIGYGRLIVGGAVISASISIDVQKSGFIRVASTSVQRNYSSSSYGDNPPKYYALGTLEESSWRIPPENYYKRVKVSDVGGIITWDFSYYVWTEVPA